MGPQPMERFLLKFFWGTADRHGWRRCRLIGVPCRRWDGRGVPGWRPRSSLPLWSRARPPAWPILVHSPTPTQPPPLAAEPPAASAARDYAPKALRAVRDLRLPMGISGLVLAFLAVQGRIDRRDPRLVFAPVTADEDVL